MPTQMSKDDFVDGKGNCKTGAHSRSSKWTALVRTELGNFEVGKKAKTQVFLEVAAAESKDK